MDKFIKAVESFFKTEVIVSEHANEYGSFTVFDLGWNKILICHENGYIYKTKHLEQLPYICDAVLTALYLSINEQEQI